ncbi:MAG TPA: hypothetical protein DEF89_10385 [Desulfosporosinus sp.]|nr:MAG: membrane protein [Desulfosporosinus sp. BICA1-9]HBW35715.1 hypothetical protein [Desulfosporosinus sp.]
MMIGLILLIIAAYYIFNSSNSKGSCCMNHPSRTHTVQDILSERYARGEIDREEYLERKQELSGAKAANSY